MADNITLNAGTGGDVIAADEITGVKHQQVKVEFGADGTATPVSDTNPLPIKVAANGTSISSSVTPLGIGATWTSASFDTSINGGYLTGLFYADQNGTHYVEESLDGTTWDIVHQDAYVALSIMLETHLSHSKYIRHKFTNGATGQGTFRGISIQRQSGFPDVMGIDDRYNVVNGDKEHNTSAPTTEAHEVIGAVAKASAPTYTEGAVVMPRVTLSGDQAVTLDGEAVVLGAGTSGIGKLTANAGVTIGAVEIAAAQTLTTITTVGTVTTLTGGGVAHDSPDSGNPVKVGGKVETQLSTVTIAADADRSDFCTDSDGAQFVKLFPEADLITERVADTGGTSTAFTNFGATAATRNLVYAISIFNSSATDGYVDFRDGAAGSILWTVPAPKGGGAVVVSPFPLFKTTANTALAYDVSGALSTVYISISGRKSKVT